MSTSQLMPAPARDPSPPRSRQRPSRDPMSAPVGPPGLPSRHRVARARRIPAVDATVRSECEAVVQATRNRDDAAEARNLLWGEYGLRQARIARLAVRVVAPPVHRPVCSHGEAVVVAGSDSACAWKPRDGLRRRLEGRLRPTPELAEVVRAPRPDGPVGPERERVEIPSSDGSDAGQDCDRDRTVDGRPVTELAVPVVAP